MPWLEYHPIIIPALIKNRGGMLCLDVGMLIRPQAHSDEDKPSFSLCRGRESVCVSGLGARRRLLVGIKGLIPRYRWDLAPSLCLDFLLEWRCNHRPHAAHSTLDDEAAPFFIFWSSFHIHCVSPFWRLSLSQVRHMYGDGVGATSEGKLAGLIHDVNGILELVSM